MINNTPSSSDIDFNNFEFKSVEAEPTSTTQEGNVEDISQVEDDSTEVDYIPRNEDDYTPPTTTKKKTEEKVLASLLEEKYGWTDVPKDIKDVDAIDLIVTQYDDHFTKQAQKIEQLETLLLEYQYKETEKQQGNTLDNLKALSPKEFLKQVIMMEEEYDVNNPTDMELLQEELDKLEVNDSIETTYKKKLRKVEKQFEKEKEVKLAQYKEAQALQAKQEELEARELETTIKSTVTSFKSDYFDVSNDDRNVVANIILNKDEEGYTGLDRLLSDPNAVMEMILAYLKAPEYKEQPKKLEKKLKNEIVNKLSDTPPINKKINKEFNMDRFLEENYAEEIPLYGHK